MASSSDRGHSGFADVHGPVCGEAVVRLLKVLDKHPHVRAYLGVACLAAFFLATPLVARADPSDKFSATISPSAVQPPGLATYTIAITNLPSSPDAATQGTVSIPGGFTVDGVVNPPQATIVSGPCTGSWTVGLGLGSIDLAAPEGAALCPGGTLALTLTVLTTPLVDGTYVWTTSLSPGFNAQSQPTLVIDGTAPDTAIGGTPPAVTGAAASFSFGGSDGSGSGVAGFECSLDAAAFASCTSPRDYGGLADGDHTFAVRAIDAVGNVDATPAAFPWHVDAVPPETTIVNGPVDPSGSSSATFEFTGADTGSSVDHFECELDGGGFARCSSPRRYDGVPDGPHAFRVRSVDAVGNPDATPASFTWTIDTIHPRVTLTDKPPRLTNRTTASFSFSAEHAGSAFECRLDGAPFAACTSPKPYSGLADGSHTFAVRAISLGNTGLATTYSWTVDTVAPQTAMASTPPTRSGSPSARFTFTSTEPGSTFACSLDALGFTPCASPKSYAGLGDGRHMFRVEAVDAAGNTDASPAVYSWQIAGVGPPTVDLTPPANVSRLRRKVGYGRLQLRWRKPADRDYDHISIYLSTSPKSQPRTLVYSGKSQAYTNKRFKNGLYYRYLVVSYDRSENASRGRSTRVPPSVLLKSPGDGRVVRSAPVLRWSAVRKATFYNVQVFYRSQKVLSAWPRKPRRALAQRWVYGGHSFSLRKGRYTWYVWPAFGPKAKSRYGQLLGQGTFKVR
jgi:hypothetical protein